MLLEYYYINAVKAACCTWITESISRQSAILARRREMMSRDRMVAKVRSAAVMKSITRAGFFNYNVLFFRSLSLSIIEYR